MNKNGTNKVKYAVSWESHPKNLLKNFCSLMEHQSLVDIVICCGNNTIQAHKFVLAANSALFREEFEKNPVIEQIILSGCDFAVVKSIVEIMYCGQTMVTEDNVKYLVAMVKLFQMKYLENLFSEYASSEEIYLPKPQFLTKKPKYPAYSYQMPLQTPGAGSGVNSSGTQGGVAMSALPSGSSVLKPVNFNVSAGVSNVSLPDALAAGLKPFQTKRKLRQQAEQACVKEAQASRLALASLQKEIAAAPQVNTFIIEDTCTETTVENFIPHSDQSPYLQAMNFKEMGNSMFMPGSNNNNQGQFNNVQTSEKRPLTADKLKYILGTDLPSNVEIMYKDSEGNFVPINEEVLQNLSTKEGLQYQVVDEDGHVGELQELHVIDKMEKLVDGGPSCDYLSGNEEPNFVKKSQEMGEFLLDGSALNIKDGAVSVMNDAGMEFPMEEAQKEAKECVESQIDLKFSPDIFFADISSENVQNEVTVVEEKLSLNEDCDKENEY